MRQKGSKESHNIKLILIVDDYEMQPFNKWFKVEGGFFFVAFEHYVISPFYKFWPTNEFDSILANV